MNIDVQEIGSERSRVIIIDDFMPNPAEVVDMAAALAPFPEVANHYYPGGRRLVMPSEPAFQYIDHVCRQISPLMREVFGVARFSITEAGFSMVTRRPEDIQVIQRIPHFDNFDLNNFAVLHYLSRPEKGGTGFYRHRRTGFEVMNAARHPLFRAGLDADWKAYGPPPVAYIDDSTPAFERIAACEGHFNRLLIYQGAVLHSGLVPPDFDFSRDPRQGRLTGNLFLHGS